MKERPIVLVIDDEPGLRDMLAYELSMEGFGVETVDGGVAAIAALRRRRFDVAITDLKMPGMDGIQTVEALRRLDPDLEIIVATGYATVETAVACMKHGAYDYIHKPYDVIELKALLEKAMEKSHLSGLVGLYEASSAILATLKTGDLISLVIELAHRVLKADAVALVLHGLDGAVPVVHEHPIGADVPADLVAALCAEASAAGESTRAEGHTRFPSALVYSLGARSRSLGHLVVLRSPSEPAFAPSELKKGDVFANQIALALDNASLHEELGHKVDELVRTREQLVQVEKLSLAGQMAHSVAHEVNNPLSLVRVNLSALRDYLDHITTLWGAARAAALYLRKLPDPAAGRLARDISGGDESVTEAMMRELGPMVTEILEGVRRISDLVGGFQRLAAAPTVAPPGAPVDLGQLVQECTATLAATDTRIALDPSLRCGAVVVASIADLRTGVVNLLSHALNPSRKRTRPGTVAVRLELDHGVTRLVIHDDTLCMTAEEQRTLFDPRLEVNTSRGRTLRLNIELSVAYQLLARNGARISVHPEGPEGVVFEIAFPALAVAA